MATDGITEDQIRTLVASKGHYTVDIPISSYGDRFLTGFVLKYWDQIVEAVKNV